MIAEPREDTPSWVAPSSAARVADQDQPRRIQLLSEEGVVEPDQVAEIVDEHYGTLVPLVWPRRRVISGSQLRSGATQMQP